MYIYIYIYSQWRSAFKEGSLRGEIARISVALIWEIIRGPHIVIYIYIYTYIYIYMYT